MNCSQFMTQNSWARNAQSRVSFGTCEFAAGQVKSDSVCSWRWMYKIWLKHRVVVNPEHAPPLLLSPTMIWRTGINRTHGLCSLQVRISHVKLFKSLYFLWLIAVKPTKITKTEEISSYKLKGCTLQNLPALFILRLSQYWQSIKSSVHDRSLRTIRFGDWSVEM